MNYRTEDGDNETNNGNITDQSSEECQQISFIRNINGVRERNKVYGFKCMETLHKRFSCLKYVPFLPPNQKANK